MIYLIVLQCDTANPLNNTARERKKPTEIHHYVNYKDVGNVVTEFIILFGDFFMKMLRIILLAL